MNRLSTACFMDNSVGVNTAFLVKIKGLMGWNDAKRVFLRGLALLVCHYISQCFYKMLWRRLTCIRLDCITKGFETIFMVLEGE